MARHEARGLARGEGSIFGAMVNGIVFDLDGVIINSHPAHKRAWRQFLLTLGRDAAESELDFILEGRKRDEMLRHFLGQLPDEDLARFGKQKDDFFQRMAEEVPPVNGVIEFLKELTQMGLPCASATSASRRRTQLTLERLSLCQQFRTVVTGEDVIEGKPNPAVYQLAAQGLDIPARDLLAFEDAPSGVRAATGAGMRCVGVANETKAKALREAGAEHIIPNFSNVSLPNLVEEMGSPADRVPRA